MRRNIVKKLLISIIIVLIIGTSFSSAPNLNQIASNKSEVGESHIIDNPKVPHFSQETGFYCRFASLTMLINYYVDNVTLNEVLFNSGIGYTQVYFHPIKIHIFPGIAICQLKDFTGEFLASLYGFSYELLITKNKEGKWGEYWSKLKEKIDNDIPVLTDVDPFALPWYKEHINASNDSHSSHSIVIVGYDESAGLIYFNDPGPTVFGESEQNCTYVSVSIEEFKDGLKNNTMPLTNYMIESFEKVTNPKSKEEIFSISHERNIQRLKGKYSEILFNIMPFTRLGLKGVEQMKRDISFGHRFTILFLIRLMNGKDPTGSSKGGLKPFHLFGIIATEKQNISQYLLENKNLSDVCVNEGNLIADEVNSWMNLSNLTYDLYQTFNNGLFKAWIESKPIFGQMKDELNQIISIEKEIIDSSNSNFNS